MEENEDIDQVTEVEQKEKTFTQSELDKIIADRLKRAKTPEDYDDLREIANDLEEYGFVGTIAEKKQALKVAKEQARVQKEIQEIEEEAENTGTSPEILKELRELKKELSEIKSKSQAIDEKEAKARKEQEEKEANEKKIQSEILEFSEKHPDIDQSKLIQDAKFVKYLNKHTGTFVEIYEDYLELINETEQSMAEKFRMSESRSTGGGKTPPSSSGAKLSTTQQNTLEDWNKRYPQYKMTPQQYLDKNK